MLDIVFITYNSSKWLKPCIQSLSESDYDLQDVSLYFHDNHSEDDTCEVIESLEKDYNDSFDEIRLIRGKENIGFGAACNRAAAYGQGEYILFLNVDTTVYQDSLKELMEAVKETDGTTAMWEMRQFPYEHPKYYDPVTGNTDWCSGACMLVRRDVFEKLGGFDQKIFMYAEDVDLSWRVRLAGYRLVYVPKAVVNHYSYQSAGEVKPVQWIQSLTNNVYLRTKYAGPKRLASGYAKLFHLMGKEGPFPDAGKKLRKAYFSHQGKYFYGRAWHWGNLPKIKKDEEGFAFIGWDYAIRREGAFYANEKYEEDALVSVLVRTCGRPSVLRETLMSLRNQTYQNLQIVVVEDGPDVSRHMIETEFRDLNIRYYAFGTNQGRSRAGNKAMELADGKYLNFLDDDDVFFADHVETLVRELKRNPSYHAAFSRSFETPISVQSENPYIYRIKQFNEPHHENFNRFDLMEHNIFPIESVMFEKKIYEDLGGFDEKIDMLEDWDLWLRYTEKYPFLTVNKTTSIYRVPAVNTIAADRQHKLDEAYAYVTSKWKGKPFHWTTEDIMAVHADMHEIQRRRWIFFRKK